MREGFETAGEMEKSSFKLTRFIRELREAADQGMKPEPSPLTYDFHPTMFLNFIVSDNSEPEGLNDHVGEDGDKIL